MDAETYKRVSELLVEAFTLPEGERTAFLDEQCAGDTSLRTEVETLLRLDRDDANDLLNDARLDAPPSNQGEHGDPVSIGEYRIVRRLGVGGMAVVFEAEQDRPRRRVALKLMTTTVHAPELEKRFRREIELLARLQHPGIAQIYSAGSETLGQRLRQWFAMELVEGESLTAHAESFGLDTSERLELFARICDAIAFANQEGVIHRDIKPDNILVTPAGEPKVLDFGVARATDVDLQSMTLMTGAGQIMGTLSYMSPEQVSGDPARIDHRSDVYSLGVVLYELLSGRRPLDLGHAPIPEAARIIREEDPTRLGSVHARHTGDVEIIVGKALEKDPSRRYQSASHLASDIRRYLANEAIAARPPSRFYQLRKLGKRHRGLVAGTAIALLALLVGLILAVRFGLDEAQQRAAAERAVYRSALAFVGAAAETGTPGDVRRALNGAPEHLRGWEWRHFDSRTSRILWETEVLRMDDSVWEEAESYGAPVQFSADGQRVVAPSGDRAFAVFDAFTGHRLREIDVGAPIVRECFLAVDRGVAVATKDGRLVVWDDRSGSSVCEDALPGSPISSAWDPKGQRLAVSCFQSRQESIERPDGAGQSTLLVGSPGALRGVMTPTGRRHSLAWTRGGRELHSMTEERHVVRIDPSTWTDSPAESKVEYWFTVAAGGSLIARRCLEEAVGLFDQEDPGGPARLMIPRQLGDMVRSIGLSRRGDLLVIGTREGRIREWETRSGRLAGVLEVKGSPNVALSPLGDLGAVNASGRLAVWSLRDESVKVLRGSGDYMYDVAWTSDGRTIVARTLKNEYFVYDAIDGGTLTTIPSQTGGEWKDDLPWALSVDGQRIVSVIGGAKRPTPVLCSFDLDCAGEFVVHEDRPWPAETHAQRRLLLEATGASGASGLPGSSSAVRFARRSASHARHETNPSGTRSLSKDGTVLMSEDGRDSVRLVEPGYAAHLSEASRLLVDGSFSPDGSRVAVARPVLGVLVHDSETGERLGEMTGHSSTVYCAAFSPDGTRIASGGIDTTVRIWDASTLESQAVLRGHSSYVIDVAWSPDGRSLASASGDGTVRVWTTISASERHDAKRDGQRKRDQLRPRVEGLFMELDDPSAVAEAVRAAADLDGEQRHAALRVVRELANECWGARAPGSKTADDGF